jgi:hypothetical protein
VPDLQLKNLGLGSPIVHSNIDNFQLRKPTVKFALAQALFHPTPRLPVRGKDAMHPSDEQFKPLIALSSTWLQSLRTQNDGLEVIERSTLLVADEGGMGKTYACSIALNWVLETKGQAVVVICPPALMPNWNSMLKKFGHQPHWLKGNQLAEGRVENGINLISTYTVQKYPLGSIIQQRLINRLSAVLIDEAHRGMIADNVLRRSLNSVCAVAKQRILVTATPMRKGRDDLFALIRSASTNTNDESAAEKAEQIYNQNEEFLFSIWLPLLAKMREDDLTIDDIRLLQEHWKEVLPVNLHEFQIVENLFDNFESKYQALDVQQKTQLAQDLHPLGRFLCCTLRDDLGKEICRSRFRTMQSRSLGYTLSDEYVNEMENILNSIDSTEPRRLLAECLMNSTPEDKYPSLVNFQPSQEDLQRFDSIFQNDERLKHLKNVFEIERHEPEQGRAKAVVIFCQYRGAIRHLARHLNSEAFAEMNLRIHTPTLHADDDESRYNSNARRLAHELRKIGYRTYGDKLDVVLCGPGVGEGHDMHWATHVVHWSIPTNAAEELAQKNWRLDRRVNGTWGASPFNSAFRITYLIERGVQNPTTRLNDVYARNRRFLLHRAFMSNLDYDMLIPPLDSGWCSREWSETPTGFFPVPSHEVSRMIRYLNGEIKDHDGLAAALAIQAFFECLGLDGEGDEMYNEGIEIDNLGVDSESFHVCTRIASRKERFELGKFSPQATPLHIISRWGRPDMSGGTLLDLEPNGRLFSVLLEQLQFACETDEVFDAYPYTLNGLGPEYLVHLGVLRVLADDKLGPALRAHWRHRLPTGLFVRDSRKESGRFESVSVGQLSADGFLEPFETMHACINDLRIPLGRPDFSAQTILNQDLIPSTAEILTPTLEFLSETGADGFTDYLRATNLLNESEISEDEPSMLIPILCYSGKTYTNNAAIMWEKMQMAQIGRNETNHEAGWW